MEYLVNQDLLSQELAHKIWETLVRKAETGNTARLSKTGFYQADDTMLFGIISVLSLIYMVGSYMIGITFVSFVLGCYENNTPKRMIGLCVVFSAIFYYSGYTLHHSQGSGAIAGGLFILHVLADMAIVHGICVVIGLTEMTLSVVQTSENTTVKAQTAVVSVAVINAYYTSL
jgi:hypothetical protein